jgi:hypothetical protein
MGSPIASSAPRALFTLPVFDNGLCPYQVPLDGQRFLTLALPEGHLGQPLTLINNWPAPSQDRAAAK